MTAAMEASVHVKPVAVMHATAMQLALRQLRIPRLQPLPRTQRASAVFVKQVAIAAIQRIAFAANATANSV
ncbi:hypothetical protein SH528x_004308 [Novipirellula sp. SH528]|uniref:hypothetical protein n=1 Tax=Novipirellula sp. SH528 TaxID=3454466 RepID=UPI003F9F1930